MAFWWVGLVGAFVCVCVRCGEAELGGLVEVMEGQTCRGPRNRQSDHNSECNAKQLIYVTS